MNEGQEVNRLTRSQQRRIEDWLLANRDKITKEGWSRNGATERLCKETGIKATVHNVIGAARTVGVNFVHAKHNGKRVKYDALLEFVCTLASKLGEPIPEELRNHKE